MHKLYTLILFLLLSKLCIAQNLNIDIGVHKINSTILLPGALDELFEEVSSGTGYDIHLGAALQVDYDLVVRAGLRTWNVPIESITNGYLNGSSIKAHEIAIVQYSGIYLRLNKQKKHFFFTGGIDLSLSTSFEGSLIIKDDYGQTIFSERNTENSILTDNFYNQLNLVLGMGPIIPLNDKITLKGFAELVISTRPIYNTGVSVADTHFTSNGLEPSGSYTNVNLSYFPLIKYGIGIGYLLR